MNTMQISNYNENSRVIVLTVGIQGSGKTTWAKELIASEPLRWQRVNRDDLRFMLHGNNHDYSSRAHENHITDASNSLLRLALENGNDVILDNTFLDGKSRKSVHLIAQEFGNVTVIEKVFCVPLEIALERNAMRTGLSRVPEDVIKACAKRYQVKPDGTFRAIKDSVTVYEKMVDVKLVQNKQLPNVIMCDLDGTLALMNGRNPYDASRCEDDLLNKPVADVVWNCHTTALTKKTIFMSGRSSKYRAETERFIKKHLPLLPYELYMRTEGDFRSDSIVKKELYTQHVAGKYYVLFVLDDRNSVVKTWRSMGLTTFQVAEGSF